MNKVLKSFIASGHEEQSENNSVGNFFFETRWPTLLQLTQEHLKHETLKIGLVEECKIINEKQGGLGFSSQPRDNALSPVLGLIYTSDFEKRLCIAFFRYFWACLACENLSGADVIKLFTSVINEFL